MKFVRVVSAVVCLITGLSTAGPAFALDLTAADIAGVRLGMSHEQARKAVEAAGYKITMLSEEPSFAQRVAAHAAQLNGRYHHPTPDTVAGFSAETPDGQELWVKAESGPTGPVVTNVQYKTPSQGEAIASFLKGVVGKYGAPTRKYDSGVEYGALCTIVPKADCLRAGQAIGGNTFHIELKEGVGRETARNRAVETAAAAQVKPAAKKF